MMCAGQPCGLLEEFASDRSDPAFGEGVCHGSADGCFEDLEAVIFEDLVEGVDELAATVSDQSPSTGEPVAVAEEEVAGGLGCPGAGGVGGETGEDHLSGGDVDEEQAVVAAQRGGVDGEEVAGDGSLGL